MKHFFIGNYLNFYYTGIPFPVRRGLGELSMAHGISSSSQQILEWMISQNVHFPCTQVSKWDHMPTDFLQPRRKVHQLCSSSSTRAVARHATRF